MRTQAPPSKHQEDKVALRNILVQGDPALARHSRTVTDFNNRLHTLLDDMADTLANANGVGLAAPQVGVLRRAVLVVETNVDEEGDEYLIELINPEIIETDGEQDGPEGCLSVPGIYGQVCRPDYVKVSAQDRYGKAFEVEGRGLTARAMCHEIDHLNGILFTELADHLMTGEEMDELRRKTFEEEGIGE